MEIKKINLSGPTLEHLPLFFRIIYYNQITKDTEEKKMYKKIPGLQTNWVCGKLSRRPISKTVNLTLLKKNKNHELE